MLKAIKYTAMPVLMFLVSNYTCAQDSSSFDFSEQMKSYDLSRVIVADSIIVDEGDNSTLKLKRAEALGFIGDNYQRFFVHFVSVIQNPTNPNEYLVYGKSKVRETVCSFQGTITIKQARIYASDELPNFKQGVATCEVVLYEDKKEASTGFFKGTYTSHFLIDDKGKFRYDAILLQADGYSNNEFVGTWTSYKTKVSKKCHWGDYRIPQSGDLDIGAGEFSVNTLYLKNGWSNYMLANFFNNASEVEAQKARQKEREQWWK